MNAAAACPRPALLARACRLRLTRAAAFALAVAAAASVVFLPALAGGFLSWDDGMWVFDNPHFRGLDWSHLRWMVSSRWFGMYMPLSWLSYAVDHALWGMDPFGYHLTNIVIHCASAAAVFFLALRLLGPGTDGRSGLPAAAFSALLFAVHPLRAESVAWISERRDVLSLFFYVLCVHLYLEAAPQEHRGWRRFIWSFAAFGLSLLSKGMAVTAPVVLLILDFYPLSRLRPAPGALFSPEGLRVLAEKAPFIAAAMVFAVLGWTGQQGVGSTMTFASYGIIQRLAQALYGATFYVEKTLLPLNLSPLYLHPSPNGFSFPYLAKGAVSIALTALFIGLRCRWPAGLAAWALYLAILSPVVGFFPFGPQITADRYSYVSCLPWAILAGAGLMRLLDRGGRIRVRALTAAAALLLVLGGLTWQQTKVWHDSETLWRQALKVQEDHPVAHGNLGVALAQQGRLDEAVGHLRRSVELSPFDAMFRNNLGCTLARLGELEQAARQFREALRLRPSLAEARRNLEKALALPQPGYGPSRKRPDNARKLERLPAGGVKVSSPEVEKK